MHSELKAYKARIIQAVGLIIGGFFCFSIADLCAKLLQEHYSIYQVLFISGFLGMLITGTWILTRHGIKAFAPHNVKLHILRGLIICTTAFCVVSALHRLPMADFYGISFLSPFFLLMLSILFLNEKVGWRRWMAVSIAFTGVLILAGPQFDHVGNGIAFALAGAMIASVGVIVLRKIGPNAPLPLYGFYPFTWITIMNFTMMIATDNYQPIEMEYIGWFALHGPIAVLGIIGTSLGYARSPEASIVAPFIYTQIIWGILFGWLFFDYLPKETTAVGLVLIIGAGIYSIWREYRNAHDKHRIIPDIT